MRNSVKVLCAGAEAATSSIPYKECSLSEDVASIFFPLQNEEINIEILPTEHSIYVLDYYTKVDIYAYAKDGDIFFNLTPLSLRTDKVETSNLFFRKLKEFVNIYLSDEICKLNSRWLTCGRKYFYLAEFYFKHNFFGKAALFTKKALNNYDLDNFQKAVLFENEFWIDCFGKKAVEKSKPSKIVNFYKPETKNIVNFIVKIGDSVDITDFMFLVRLVDPKKLKYLERIHFFHACARIFSRKSKVHLAVFNYINTYFSVQDGYNVDFKRYLSDKALKLAKGNWKCIIKNILNTIGRNEAEEIRVCMGKGSLYSQAHTTKYTDLEHTSYFILRVSSFDNIVSFKARDVFYARDDIFEEGTVYYINYIRLELVVKEESVEILQLDGSMLNKNQNVLSAEKRVLSILKVLSKGEHVVNVECHDEFVLEHIKFKDGSRNICSKVKPVKLLRVEPTFTYKILGMSQDSFGAFHLRIRICTKESRKPRVFCVGNEGLIAFGSDNRLFEVTIPKKSISYGLVQLLCEVSEEVYKKYIFKQDGEKFLLQ